MQMLHAVRPTLLSLLQCGCRPASVDDNGGGGGLYPCLPAGSSGDCVPTVPTVSDIQKETEESSVDVQGEVLGEGPWSTLELRLGHW